MVAVLFGVSFINYQTSQKLTADTQVVSERLSRNRGQLKLKQPTNNKDATIKTTPKTDQSVQILAQNSAYAADTQSGKLVEMITSSLTYANGNDLRTAYDKNKSNLTGSFWSDVYGKLKSSGEPAINAFASEIDTLNKTSKANQATLTKANDGSYTIILTVTQGGNKSSGATHGSSIYQFVSKPTETGFDTTLTNILITTN